MRLIISPAKKMCRDSDSFAAAAAPQFLEQAEELRAYLQTLDYDQCRALWRCNDTIEHCIWQVFVYATNICL